MSLVGGIMRGAVRCGVRSPESTSGERPAHDSPARRRLFRRTGRRMAPGSMRGEVEGWRCGGTRCRLGRLRGARDGSAASSMPRRMHCSRVL